MCEIARIMCDFAHIKEKKLFVKKLMFIKLACYVLIIYFCT